MTKRAVGFLMCCALVAPLPGWQAGTPGAVRRLYVEPFTTKAGSEELRADLMGELRKQNTIALAADEAGADATLGGGGEIWIQGYRSLNPRSGRLPSDGTPVYAGYLAVELRNRRGETLWSYLATPGTASSEEVSKDLAKRIAKHLVEALKQGETAPPPSALPQPAIALTGAGATFPYPVYAKWLTNYRRENPNVEIRYNAVGSENGVRTLLAGGVDFGASDSPEVVHQLAPKDEAGYLLFPSVVGAVAPIVNLPGFTGSLAFTPEALAGIYLGTIKKWNDPILRQANRGVQLPDLDIVVVHRADGSGTSYAWTDFLSKTVPEWKAQVGADLDPRWPVGRAAAGNEGVARLVKELGGSIGYVEFIYALQNHLSFGKVRNRRGEFVEASLESIAAAANQPVEIHDDFKVSIVDSPGEGAYPIASFTWLVVPAHIADEGKRTAMADFLKWMLGPGQRQAAALGYLELPKELVLRERAAIGKLH
jgi:phosphate transport system substrate-binding protein